jgi:predicted MFS family arabinose efflux permease
VLFAWIREPAASPAPARSISLLLEPVRHPDFRRFLLFTCLWSGVTMFGSSFMQLHTLQNLHVSVGMTTLIWSTVGVGMALSSRWWGHQVDRFGQRPVLKVCIAFKPLVALVFVLVTPRTAPWVLPLVFAVDAVWNAGILVASNGYMLKSSPRQNRSMYVAAFSGLAAICGGLGSLAGGALLHLYSDFSLAFAGRVWSNYHLLFFVNTLMRVACYPMLSHIREPASRSMEEAVLGMQATWPMRLLLFPLDLYRRLDAGWDSMWRRGPGA